MKCDLEMVFKIELNTLNTTLSRVYTRMCITWRMDHFSLLSTYLFLTLVTFLFLHLSVFLH